MGDENKGGDAPVANLDGLLGDDEHKGGSDVPAASPPADSEPPVKPPAPVKRIGLDEVEVLEHLALLTPVGELDAAGVAAELKEIGEPMDEPRAIAGKNIQMREDWRKKAEKFDVEMSRRDSDLRASELRASALQERVRALKDRGVKIGKRVEAAANG